MSVLELNDVSKTYRSRQFAWSRRIVIEAVKNVSLRLDEGTCLALVGESGSGKSTLGKIVLGLEQPDRGEITFLGCSLHRVPAKERKQLRRDMQLVFQDSHSAVNPRMTALRIIAEPLRVHERMTASEQLQRVRELLEVVGLRGDDAGKYPHQFSGGQLQRICIARAIALKPRLIVLDEAVNSLDVLVQASILRLLGQLKERYGLSYLFISHDLAAVRLLADRVAVMEHGEIVETLDDASRLDELHHPAGKRLLQAVLPIRPYGLVLR